MRILTICSLMTFALMFSGPLETDAMELTDDDQYRLAKIAMAEAEEESTEGKALVMCVVLNRVNSRAFPNSIYGVLFQKNQFTPCTVDGRYYDVEPDSDCWAAVDMVMNGWDKSDGATYFCIGTSSFHKHLTYLFQYGKHKFYK